MKPHLINYIIAHLIINIQRILILGLPFLFLYKMVPVFFDVYTPLSDVGNLCKFLFYSGCALLMGILSAIITSLHMMQPFINMASRINGGPFSKGDFVHILVGQHKGKIVKVYSNWQHGDVRVELGDEYKDKFGDIYSSHMLYKENKQKF